MEMEGKATHREQVPNVALDAISCLLMKSWNMIVQEWAHQVRDITMLLKFVARKTTHVAAGARVRDVVNTPHDIPP
jgi:hypothetical protein